MPLLPSGMTDRPVFAPCGYAISRNDMPELKPFNLSYARPKDRNVNDVPGSFLYYNAMSAPPDASTSLAIRKYCI